LLSKQVTVFVAGTRERKVYQSRSLWLP